MIIDSHAHTVGDRSGPAFPSLNARWAGMEASGGYGGPPPLPPEEDLLGGAELQVALMDDVGTDVQLTSPRPFIMKHSSKPGQLVHWWAALHNDAIALQVKAYPDRIRGIGTLPQVAGAPITDVFDELDRCVHELGFIGLLLNPDPYEGTGDSPVLSDEYWFPLYERLSELDLPILLHSAGCYGRENYSEHFISEESLAITSIIRARVFDTFPRLKIIVPHGGGSIPYQLGRWQATFRAKDEGETFRQQLQRFYFDTCLYTQDALELLIRTVGSDRVLFGTERPGSGHDLEILKPVIENIGWLTDEDRARIFETNARTVYSRL